MVFGLNLMLKALKCFWLWIIKSFFLYFLLVRHFEVHVMYGSDDENSTCVCVHACVRVCLCVCACVCVCGTHRLLLVMRRPKDMQVTPDSAHFSPPAIKLLGDVCVCA